MPDNNFQRYKKCCGRSGSTLLEMVFALAIVAILAGALSGLFGTFDTRQSLDKGVLAVVSLLEKARANAIGGQQASNFGVHLEEGKAVLFRGSMYSASDPANETVLFPGPVSLSSLSLAGGGSNIVFSRLSGTTTASGTAIFSTGDASSTRTITIYANGFAE